MDHTLKHNIEETVRIINSIMTVQLKCMTVLFGIF